MLPWQQITTGMYIQFRKSVTWLVMLNLQDPWSDHLTASSQPWPIVFSSVLFPAGPSNQRNHLQCHGWSLAITCYAMASVREPCEGSRHFIENGCIERMEKRLGYQQQVWCKLGRPVLSYLPSLVHLIFMSVVWEGSKGKEKLRNVGSVCMVNITLSPFTSKQTCQVHIVYLFWSYAFLFYTSAIHVVSWNTLEVKWAFDERN